jgi:hypothetical protein
LAYILALKSHARPSINIINRLTRARYAALNLATPEQPIQKPMHPHIITTRKFQKGDFKKSSRGAHRPFYPSTRQERLSAWNIGAILSGFLTQSSGTDTAGAGHFAFYGARAVSIETWNLNFLLFWFHNNDS